ncbi:MAG: 3-hydroxyacyl-ACP dehydratase FabZ [Proteobacteria bacterium]|nr:3-hydroxyacyl-ACP dehydratase FabZ [Pseudomonadota bacterium]
MDEAATKPIDIGCIMQLIPHRYPMLMIDRIVEAEPGERAVAIKNVTINESFFQGHFPTRPVMPGVLIIEAMAQTAAALVAYTLGGETEGKIVFFTSIDTARFRRPVTPGDCLKIEVTKERRRGNLWRFRGEAKADGVLMAEAVFAAMIMDD